MRGLDFGELRHLARTLQAAELLPKATKRQPHSPPEITTRHAAIFLIALGTSRSSGARTPAELRRRVNRFKKLVTLDGFDGQKSKLLGDLVHLIDLYRNRAWLTDKDRKWSFGQLVFIVDDQSPEVWIELILRQSVSSRERPVFRRLSYVSEAELARADDDVDFDLDEFCAPAYVLNAGIFHRLRELLGPIEPQQALG